MEFPDLEKLIPVIRLRVARDLKSKGCDPVVLHSELQTAMRKTSEHDRLIRWSPWYDTAHGSGMVRHAKLLADRFGVTTRAVEANILKDRVQIAGQQRHNELIIKKSFQKTALRLAAEAGPDRCSLMERTLDSKLRRWTIPLLPGRRAPLAVRRLSGLKDRVPPRCIFAVIRAWCDGWVVQKRFGDRSVRCLMGCDDHDSIEHYACCPQLREVARTRLGLEAPGNPAAMLEAFFLLGPGAAQEELRKRALWCGAVYRWHGIVRHRAGLLDGRGRLEVLHHVLRDLFAGTRTVL